VVKAWGYAARNAGVPGAALDWLDASLDTLSPYLTATASLRRYILWYVWPPHGCGPLEEIAVGGMALTERGVLLELWNHVRVFYWQLPLSGDCVKQTQACRDLFQIIWESSAGLLCLCLDVANGGSKNLSLGLISFGFLVKGRSRGKKG